MDSSKIRWNQHWEICDKNCRGRCLVSLFYSSCSLKSFNYFRKYIEGHKVAIVCSARSGSTKALGTTNLLLRAASEALRSSKPTRSTSSTPTPRCIASSSNGDYGASQRGSPRSASPASGQMNGFAHFFDQSTDFFKTVDLIRQQHLDAARDSVVDPTILQELEQEIDRDCDFLKNFLLAAKVCPK